jgi:large subunit ribosomal protein L10
MSTNRDGKVAVVDAVRARLDDSDGAVVTEYRGLTVAEMAGLRRVIRAVGGDFKVFKNTLVRRAIEGSPHEPLTDLLEGPTAIAFVRGDVSAVAKALRDFAKAAPALVVKGGVLDGSLLDARELGALAELPSREVLLSMLAGGLAAPMRTMAGLLKAVPQSLAYGLSALIEARGGAPAPAEAAPETTAETVVASPESEDAASHDAPSEDAPGQDAPGQDAATTAPVGEAAVTAPEGASDDAAPQGAGDDAPPEIAVDEAPNEPADEAAPEADADGAPSEDEPAGD